MHRDAVVRGAPCGRGLPTGSGTKPSDSSSRLKTESSKISESIFRVVALVLNRTANDCAVGTLNAQRNRGYDVEARSKGRCARPVAFAQSRGSNVEMNGRARLTIS